MDTTSILKIIQRRRDEFWDAQTYDSGEGSQRARAIADEYDALLAEIRAHEAAEKPSTQF